MICDHKFDFYIPILSSKLCKDKFLFNTNNRYNEIFATLYRKFSFYNVGEHSEVLSQMKIL